MNAKALLLRCRPFVPEDLQQEIDLCQDEPKRARRLPPDWSPDHLLLSWAMKERPDLSVSTQVDNFRDYWNAKAGKDACKLDWDATFRNWIRNCKYGSKPLPTPPKPIAPQEVARVRRKEETAVNPQVKALLDAFASKMRINVGGAT